MGVRRPSSCTRYCFPHMPADLVAGREDCVPHPIVAHRSLDIARTAFTASTPSTRPEFAWTSRSPSSAFPHREREVLPLVEVTYAAYQS